MNSSIDQMAKYYDEVYADFISPTKTDQEIQFIQNIIGPQADILDIGCGTGRHLIPLDRLNYQVTGVDTSSGMLAQIKNKYPKARTMHGNILELNLNTKYDLIMMMWNVINELALTSESLTRLLVKCSQLIKQQGKILINLSYEEEFSPDEFDFYFEKSGKQNHYQVSLRVLDYKPELQTTLSHGHIKVYNSKNQIVDSTLTLLSQRWWPIAELELAAGKQGFRPLQLQLSTSKDIYLILNHE